MRRVLMKGKMRRREGERRGRGGRWRNGRRRLN